MTTAAAPKSLRIGVMMEDIQFSDIAGVDMLGNLSREYFDKVLTMDVDGKIAPFQEHPVDTTIYYISSTLEPAPMTAGIKICPNITYDDCPRDLDIVFIGGPLPSHRPPQANKFMKEAFEQTKTWITTCTGAIWLASSGVLDGRKCTTNRQFLDGAKLLHPEVDWQDKRWVIEEKPWSGEGGKGELWTGGGAWVGE
jgi:transcriptional regulator GlxA family with amidase domain